MGGKWAKVWLSAPLEASRTLKRGGGGGDGVETGQPPVVPPVGCPHPAAVTAEEHRHW